MKQTFTLFFFLVFNFSFGQIVSDFETLNIEPDSFLNGSDGSGGFTNGNLFFPNDYNDAWGSWSGWAMSNSTDVTDPEFTNQYSSIVGAGAMQSSNYAVSFVSGESILKIDDTTKGDSILGMYITNGTYPYLVIRDGNQFSKKFGGVTGDDPDYFLLTIKKYLDGNLSTDSVDFYLADYRFADNSEDYIIDDWTFVDLSSLGKVDSLSFTMASTDVGQFGINTPTYFCADNITTSEIIQVSNSNLQAQLNVEIFPNPTSDFLFIKNLENQNNMEISIYNMLGQEFQNNTITNYSNSINVQNLPKGTYLIKVQDGEKQHSQLFVKQ